jgi:hypothetical protein
MRSPLVAFVLTFAVGCGGYVFAADDTPQPLTRADCDAASMTWNDDANVCGAAEAAAAPEAAAPEAAAPAAPAGEEATAEGQPLTRADCDAAGMKWNDDANVCGAAEAAAAPEAAAPEAAAPASGEAAATGQPLTRADCDAAGMTWNDAANVCGSGATAQPLTRADCDAAGMRWNDNRNVCGLGAMAGGHKREVTKEVKKGGKKIVKKVKTSHGVKKTVVHKDHHKQEPAPKKGGFLQWLKKKNKP